MNAPEKFERTEFLNDPKKQFVEYGKYLVVRKDGKIHMETYNGTGWAYNHKAITHFYLPKIN